MNTEEKIYSKIKNASQQGEKDFPGMDKVWNRVEEKLNNTIVVKKKNTWQKLAIAATVLLSFSIIYHFVSNEEVNTINKKSSIRSTENPIIVSTDSVNKIIEKAKEVVVENSPVKKPIHSENPILDKTDGSVMSFAPTTTTIDDSAYKMEFKNNGIALEEKEMIAPKMNKNLNLNNANEVSLRNSVSNSASSNNGYLANGKKYPTSKFKAKKTSSEVVELNKDLVVIDGVAMDKKYDADKELNKISSDDIEEVTHLPNPLYIINGVEYSEESLFGKTPTSPYAPLDKQKITSTNILKPADATKIYGKKGENGIVIITTKDGKPTKK